MHVNGQFLWQLCLILALIYYALEYEEASLSCLWGMRVKSSEPYNWRAFLSWGSLMAILHAVANSVDNKCFLTCTLISNSLHAHIGHTHEDMAVTLEFHQLDRVLQP